MEAELKEALTSADVRLETNKTLSLMNWVKET